jgi:hypothetical protein
MFEIVGFFVCLLIGAVFVMQGFFGVLAIKGLTGSYKGSLPAISIFLIGVVVIVVSIMHSPIALVVTKNV